MRALPFTFVLLFVAGCLVTDEIEFEDDVNYPPQLLSMSPSNQYIGFFCADDNLEFSMTVWDPDPEDVDTFDANIYFAADPSDSAASPSLGGSCVLNELVTSADDDDDTNNVGVQMKVDCSLNNIPAPGDLNLVKIVASDLGFVQGVAPEDARTVEVLWVKELLADELCQ